METIKPEKIIDVWQDYPQVHEAFDKAIYLVPSMPIDYSVRHSSLYKVKKLPFRLGEDPLQRMKKWGAENKEIQLWPIPFRIMNKFTFYQEEFK